MIMRNIAQVGSLLVVGWVHLWPLVAAYYFSLWAQEARDPF